MSKLRMYLAILPLWLLVVAYAVYLFVEWPHLPARMAIHFGMTGEANNWSSPMVFAVFSLAVLGLVCGVLSRQLTRQSRGLTGALFCYSVAMMVVAALWQVVRFNVDGTASLRWVMPAALVVVALAVARTFGQGGGDSHRTGGSASGRSGANRNASVLR